MSKVIRKVFKTDTLSLHECSDGYYLYDYVLGMNVSMRASTEQDAFIDTILYYQRKLTETKTEFKNLKNKVDNFINQVIIED